MAFWFIWVVRFSMVERLFAPLPPQSLLTSGLVCTTFATWMVFVNAILSCMVCFYQVRTRVIDKISCIKNTSTIGTEANDHAFFDVG